MTHVFLFPRGERRKWNRDEFEGGTDHGLFVVESMVRVEKQARIYDFEVQGVVDRPLRIQGSENIGYLTEDKLVKGISGLSRIPLLPCHQKPAITSCFKKTLYTYAQQINRAFYGLKS